MAEDDPDKEDRDRLRRSFAGFALVLILALAAFYLVLRLHTANQIEVCLEAGHRNCDSLGDQ